MPVYVRLHKLTAKGAQGIKDFENSLKESRKKQESMGIKVIASYATLGEYDFVSIVDAPSDEAAFKISAVLGSIGVVSTVTMRAMPTEKFAEMAKGL